MTEFEVIKDYSRLKQICREIEDAAILGGDLETTSDLPRIQAKRKPLVSLDLFDEEDDSSQDEESSSVAFCQPFEGKIRITSLNTGSHIYIVDHFLCKNVDILYDALKRNKGIKIFQNVKYDAKWALFHHDWDIFP